MRRAARGLVAMVPAPQQLVSSPLVRAVETAEIIGDAYDRMVPETVSVLQPGAGPEPTLAWLRRLPADGRVVAVGHEPDLSILASVLLAARDEPIMGFRKGGACFLVVPAGVVPGSASLEWFLTPRQLRLAGA